MYGDTRFSANIGPADFAQNFQNYYPPPRPAVWYYRRMYRRVPEAHGLRTDQPDVIFLARAKREANREFIETFLAGEREDCATNSVAAGTGLKISEMRSSVVKAYGMIASLERSRAKLDETVGDDEWKEKWQECTGIREEIARVLDTFDPYILAELEKRLKMRAKKRGREARKRARRRVEKVLARERRGRRDEEADAWIREKNKTIEREKQMENLRKDADIVLSDVRGKRNDARKFLSLLQELQNLRRVKVNVARARGENFPTAADQAFDNIIGQLVEQWKCLDREYSIEEQGLKLMLKADNERKIDKQKINTFDDWERALFGRTLRSSDTWRTLDVDRLVTIRRAWDKYVNFEGEGSRVPIGWVMPVPPSSAAWQKSLRTI